MRHALALRPNDAVIHANLAEAYRASGDCERAVGCCRTALQLAPEYGDALCNLGAALHASFEAPGNVVSRHDPLPELFGDLDRREIGGADAAFAGIGLAELVMAYGLGGQAADHHGGRGLE